MWKVKIRNLVSFVNMFFFCLFFWSIIESNNIKMIKINNIINILLYKKNIFYLQEWKNVIIQLYFFIYNNKSIINLIIIIYNYETFYWNRK